VAELKMPRHHEATESAPDAGPEPSDQKL
jgi:hypothetical protein